MGTSISLTRNGLDNHLELSVPQSINVDLTSAFISPITESVEDLPEATNTSLYPVLKKKTSEDLLIDRTELPTIKNKR